MYDVMFVSGERRHYTGAHLVEIVAMRWQDVDFRQRTVTISRSLSSTKRDGLINKPPENDRVRIVCVASHLLTILESHRAVQAAERIAARPSLHRGLPRLRCRGGGSVLEDS